MNRRIFAVWASLMILLSIVVILIEVAPSVEAPSTLYVGGVNPGNYSHIQWAIDNASSGDTVFVYNGTYYENVLVNKTLSLIGEDRDSTIIHGGGNGDVVRITEDGVNITGFNVTGSGPNSIDYGIEVYNAWNCLIISNRITINRNGIWLYSSSNINITANTFSYIHRCLLIEASSHCNITKNNFFSIYEGFHIEGSYNNVISNRISMIERIGIHLLISSNNNIINNTVSSSDYKGIYISMSSFNNIVKDNFIYSITNEGISIWSSSNNIVTHNHVANNGYGIGLESGSSNSIYHNNIIGNSNQAYDYTDNQNQWDNGYPSGGNYWSDYIGVDNLKGPNQDISGSDGIGDTNYSIDSDSVDNYPLMSPFGNYSFLYEGWNLISIPFIQTDTNLSIVLDSIKDSYDAVQWYNVSDTLDYWKHNHISKPSHLNDLNDIDHTMGFWIHITEPGGVLFQYNGTQPTSNQSITLHPGWNMVGYPSLYKRNRTAALNNIVFDQDLDAIWTFEAATQTWQEIGSTDSFELERGYWIHSKVTKVWDVPL
jgi:parallel beta-helix repeat protein